MTIPPSSRPSRARRPRADHLYRLSRAWPRSGPCPPEEWTLDTFADDVVRLCDALGVEKPIVLGQSFGGFVAQRYLARHPRHPEKVILSSTSHHLGLARKIAMFQQLGGAAAREAARAFWSTPNCDTWARYEQVCLPLYNQVHPANNDARARVVFNSRILFESAAGEQQGMNLLTGLRGVSCPVLVMAGALDLVCPLCRFERHRCRHRRTLGSSGDVCQSRSWRLAR